MLDTIVTAVAIIIPTGTIIAAAAAMRQRFLDHEELDNHRFEEVKDVLLEIKADIKELLKEGK